MKEHAAHVNSLTEALFGRREHGVASQSTEATYMNDNKCPHCGKDIYPTSSSPSPSTERAELIASLARTIALLEELEAKLTEELK